MPLMNASPATIRCMIPGHAAMGMDIGCNIGSPTVLVAMPKVPSLHRLSGVVRYTWTEILTSPGLFLVHGLVSNCLVARAYVPAGCANCRLASKRRLVSPSDCGTVFRHAFHKMGSCNQKRLIFFLSEKQLMAHGLKSEWTEVQ